MDEAFNYIIVGAGSAGCVLANRLSEDPERRVCLLEAGPSDRSALIDAPMGLALMGRNRAINWRYDTVAQPALDNRSLFWPRGRVLGGSSAINAMIYMRGAPQDYDDWERAAGENWGWARVRTLFRRMEGNTALSDDHHGVDGPLCVSDLRHVNPLSRAFVRAGVETGLPERRDFNGAAQEGVGLFQVTQKAGRRFSSARAFLDPARGRPNLTIETGALAHRVILRDRRAVGVALAGREVRLRAGGEVLLCGGAVNSPQLLMLSGVGPGAALRAAGVEPAVEAPEVGQNLADHLDATVLARENGREALGLSAGLPLRAMRGVRRWRRDGGGEWSSNIAEAGGFARSDPDRDRPNLQLHFLPALLKDHGRALLWGHGVTLHVCDLLPRSRGSIGLAGPDPEAAPRIDPAYLSAPEDAQTLLDGVKLARRILAAPALASRLRGEIAPGPAVVEDAALIDDIRARAESIYHPVGSCRMGADAASVVDEQARLRGVEGLRVVDASIMPSLVAGNTNAPTMMIAENVADMMLGRV